MLATFRALTDRALFILATWLLLALLFCVVAGVISRQLNAPLAWTDELAQYLLVWSGFCGWMIASRKRSHIRITVFVERLPQIAARIVEIVTQLGMIAFGFGLIFYARALIVRTWDIESISLPLPAAVLYMPLPLLGLLMIAQAVGEISDALRGPVHVPGGQVL